MNDWQSVRLGDNVRIEHGWPFKSEMYDDVLTGKPVVVSIGNFRYTGGFRFDETKRKEYRGAYPKQYELAPNDVLLVMTCQTSGGEILGIPAKVPNDGYTYLHNQRIGKVVPTSVNVDKNYLYWLFLSKPFNQWLCATASGSKILHTAPNRIEGFEFALPPLNEQRAIAHVLSALDDKIELNRRMNATLEEMARTLFRSWFVDFEPFGGVMPNDWRIGKFGDFIERLPVGKKFEQKTVSPTGKVPVLDQGRSGIIGYHDEEPGVVASPENPIIVFANHTCYMRLISYPFSAIQNVLPFVGSGVNTLWAYYATVDKQSFIEYKGHWPDFIINESVVPPLEVTETFGSLVRPMVEKVLILERENISLSEIRDTLLPKLISGEVRLSQEIISQIDSALAD